MTTNRKRLHDNNVEISRKTRLFGQCRELLQILFIPGITESLYVFLMEPIDSTRHCCNTNLQLFFQMREICKTCKLLSLRLYPWICPEIGTKVRSLPNLELFTITTTPEKSKEKLDAWTQLLPKLQSIQTSYSVVHPTITTVYFHCHATLLCEKTFKKWDCIRLQHLDLTYGGWIEPDVLMFLENKFPNLTHLAISILSDDDDHVTMKDMNNVIELEVSTRGSLFSLHASNMKSLRKFCIRGRSPSVEFTCLPDLEDLRVYADELIFHDKVLLRKLWVRTVHHHEKNLIIDPHDKVCWENLQYLNFEHSDAWERICPRLESLHTLICWQYKIVPNINFSKLQQLSHLEWYHLNFNLFQLFDTFNILNTLELHWESDYVFDFANLSKFQNIRKVTISETVGKSVNIASLLALPKLEYLDTCFNNLNESDDKLLNTWEVDNPFKHP
jgi:hypothetical protein